MYASYRSILSRHESARRTEPFTRHSASLALSKFRLIISSFLASSSSTSQFAAKQRPPSHIRSLLTLLGLSNHIMKAPHKDESSVPYCKTPSGVVVMLISLNTAPGCTTAANTPRFLYRSWIFSTSFSCASFETQCCVFAIRPSSVKLAVLSTMKKAFGDFPAGGWECNGGSR